jgi:hypothetical protein
MQWGQRQRREAFSNIESARDPFLLLMLMSINLSEGGINKKMKPRSTELNFSISPDHIIDTNRALRNNFIAISNADGRKAARFHHTLR